jgi:hypothetical protein
LNYTGAVSDRGANDFRERARVEADRYGPDPWIFVRELLQNARDAGATRVVIEVEEADGSTRIRCRDDGEGMSYEHARRYLFSLYASSKEDRADQVGRFGVGFWSILRFEPEHIVIRSCARSGGGGWQVVLDGALQSAEREGVDMTPGTEVILERPASDGADDRRVFEAAHQNARFLGLRDAPETPLPITVNGRLVNAEFRLAPPSASFRRGHVRGVVGLGNAPRVELFSRGLRVRSAACLDDLLSTSGHTGHSRVRFPELPGGLAPQALLESDGLDLLLSRSDARDTRTLRRLVKLGQSELRHLVERQLANIRPPGVGERIAGLIRRLAGESAWWRALLGAMTGALLALLIAQVLWPSSPPRARAELGTSAGPPDRTVYGDLRKRYHGPQVSELDPSAAEPLALRYQPRAARPYFAAVIIEDVTGEARTTAPLTDQRYPGQVCVRGCLTVELPIAGSTELPLPIPSGHRLDVDSIEFEPAARTDLIAAVADEVGMLGPERIMLSRAGEAILLLDWPVVGILRYQTGPGYAISVPERGDALPSALRREAQALRGLEPEARVEAAIDLVRARVRYETSPTVAVQHQRASSAGKDFVTRTLEIGAGDCDVQNGLLVAILHAAAIDARLAVGWVGHQGGVSAWLHAWVEYLDDEGRWQVADATARGVADGASIAGLPPAPAEVAVGTLTRPAGDPGSEPALDRGEGSLTGNGGLSNGGPSDDGGDEGGAAAAGRDPSAAESGPSPNDDDDPLTRMSRALVELLGQRWVPWLALGSGLLGLGLLGLSFARRTDRRFTLEDGGDLSSLLQGALAQPAAFRHLPELFHRRLIPLRGGAAISLDRARSLGARGRLYAGREQTELSRSARQRGVSLLDAETPEGRTVAASLGAIDLDRWGRRLERAVEVPILGVVAAYLREHDERWRCAASRGLGDKLATLDLQPLGRRLGDRLVLLDADDPLLASAERLRSSRPQAAAFALLDHMLEQLDIDGPRRARLLAPLAARAVEEAAAAAKAGGAAGVGGARS